MTNPFLSLIMIAACTLPTTVFALLDRGDYKKAGPREAWLPFMMVACGGYVAGLLA